MTKKTRKTYKIHDQEFTSQKAAQDHVRGILGKYQGELNLGPDAPEFEFLVALVRRHPEAAEKIGVGISHFFVKLSAYRNLELWIARTDETVIDISYPTAIRGVAKTAQENLLSAMRQAIVPQVNEYRAAELAKGVATCPGWQRTCGAVLDSLAPVDHVEPFTDLADRFLAGRQAPSEFADGPTNAAAFKPEDAAFEAEWLAFHAKEATLQLLCSPCNGSKGSK